MKNEEEVRLMRELLLDVRWSPIDSEKYKSIKYNITGPEEDDMLQLLLPTTKDGKVKGDNRIQFPKHQAREFSKLLGWVLESNDQ